MRGLDLCKKKITVYDILLTLILIIIIISFGTYISTYILSNTHNSHDWFDKFYNNVTVLESNNSVVTEKWLKHKTGKRMKHCSSYYVREFCSRHIEDHVCYKYKYYFHGSLDIPCYSNMDTSFIFNLIGWSNTDCFDGGTRYGDYIDGYIFTRITDEYYFKNNVTQEKLNEVFKFNNTLKDLCNHYNEILLPCCNKGCSLKVYTKKNQLNHISACDVHNELLERNVSYNPKYKNSISLNINKIISELWYIFLISFPFLLCGLIIFFNIVHLCV